jgi:hypothetical protein
MRIRSIDGGEALLRRMNSQGFDFSLSTLIYFNVCFEMWPPPREAITVLSRRYGNLTIHEPVGCIPGDVTFQIYDRVSYELVTRVQRGVTRLVGLFSGRCESWGVWSVTYVAEDHSSSQQSILARGSENSTP